MNIQHQRAIELKYEGKTHSEISKALNGRLSKGTLDVYFSRDGLLLSAYLEYQDITDTQRWDEGKRILKKEVVTAVTAIVDTLHEAKAKGNGPTVLKAAQTILDRAGIQPKFKGKQNETGDGRCPQCGDIRFKTEDEFREFYDKFGLDIATGQSIQMIKTENDAEKAKFIKNMFNPWFENGILGADKELEIKIIRKSHLKAS